MTYGITPKMMKVFGSRAEHQREMVEDAVARMCDKYGVDFAYVSDTGTVENLIEEGYSFADIANEEIPEDVFLDNVYPLD